MSETLQQKIAANISGGVLHLKAANNLGSDDIKTIVTNYFGGELIARVSLEGTPGEDRVTYHAQVQKDSFLLFPKGVAGTLTFAGGSTIEMKFETTVVSYKLTDSLPQLPGPIGSLSFQNLHYILDSSQAETPSSLAASLVVGKSGFFASLYGWILKDDLQIVGNFGLVMLNGRPDPSASLTAKLPVPLKVDPFTLDFELDAGIKAVQPPGSPPGGDADPLTTTWVQLKTQFKTRSLTLDTVMPLHGGGSRLLTLTLDPKQARQVLSEGFEALGGFLDSSALAGLMRGIPSGRDMELKRFQVVVDPVRRQLVHFEFGIELNPASPWQIIGNQFALENLTAVVNLGSPDDSKAFTAMLSATLKLGDVQALFEVQLPEKLVTAGLAPGTTVSLDDFFEQFSPGMQLPGTGDLVFGALGLRADLGTADYQFQAKAGGKREIFKGFTIDSLDLGIERADGALKSAQLSAEFVIGDVTVDLNAVESDGHWSFSGSTGPGQQIAIGKLIDDLAGLFGLQSNQLPTAIQDLVIDNIHISHDTGDDGKFEFGLETRFPLAGHAVDLVLDLTLAKDDGVWDKSFSGKIEIGEKTFSLTIDGDTIKGSFTASGAPLTLQDLADTLGLEAIEIPSLLDLGIKQADFTYQRDAKEWTVTAEGASHGEAFFQTATDPGQTRGYVFGVTYKKPISTAELPLVGGELGNLLAVEQPTIVVSSLKLDNYQLPLGGDDNQADMVPGIQLFGLFDFKNGAYTHDFSLLLYGTQHRLPGPPSSDEAPATAAPYAMTPVTDASGPGIWITIQRQFGPVHFNKIGVRFQSGRIWVDFNASLVTAGLSLELFGLGLGFLIDQPEDIHGELDGLGIDFQKGDLTLSGGFLKNPNAKAPVLQEYDGGVMVEAGNFTLSALGSYAKVKHGPDVDTSMFIFGFLGAPLGGPPFFFITGLAGGVGFNRGLNLPSVANVPSFPFVEAAGSSDGGPFSQITDPIQALGKLGSAVPVKLGEDWAAAGIRFNSFEMLQSFALVTVIFGSRFEVGLLGTSSISVPTGAADPIAYAEIALEAAFDPAEGLLEMAGQLTPDSYILSKSCQLTGGFAFNFWFDQGQFVVTFGGYSPYFNVPATYPSVPRLGMVWQVSDHLVIKGGEYYALTPSCLMAGGYLQASFHAGSIKAWFNLMADFIIGWKPFFYHIEIQVEFGVSVRLDLLFTTKTISVHVGAGLTLHGPKFGGRAHIHLSVVSFTIHLGSSGPKPTTSWAEFKQSFLPKKTTHYLRGTITAGLLKDLGGAAEASEGTPGYDWVVSPHAFTFQIETVVPAKTATIKGAAVPVTWATDFGVGPVGVSDSDFNTSHLTIGLEREGQTYTAFSAKPVLKNAPKGLWGPPEPNPGSDRQTIADTLAGFELSSTPKPPDVLRPVNIANLQYDDVDNFPFSWQVPSYPTTDPFDQSQALQQIQATFVEGGSQKSRAALIDAMAAFGLAVDPNTKIQPFGTGNSGFILPPTLSLLGENRS